MRAKIGSFRQLIVCHVLNLNLSHYKTFSTKFTIAVLDLVKSINLYRWEKGKGKRGRVFTLF